MLKGCYLDVTGELLGCYRGVTANFQRVLLGYFNDVKGMFHHLAGA